MTNQILNKKIPARSFWQDWDQFLQHSGFRVSAAALMEASGPMNIFLAQIIHFGSPFLRVIWPGGHWESLADMLEDRQQSRDFVSFLRSKENA